MGIRQQGYWLRQADAIERQFIASIGCGVRIGMADSADNFRMAMDELDLPKERKESKGHKNQANWDFLYMKRGGKSV